MYRFALSRLGWLAPILVALLLTPFRSEAHTPSWLIASGSSASYLQQGVATTWLPVSVGGPSRSHLPSSIMPHNDVQCSVDTSDPGAPPTCSIAPGAGTRCSAHCSSGQFCSAFESPAVPNGIAQCSTAGVTRGVCSVLQSPVPGSIAPSLCSAFNNDPVQVTQCSVVDVGRKQFCSVENPSLQQFSEHCSANTTANGGVLCSVLNGGPRKNFCSAAFQGTKLCSTFGGGRCSIVMGQRGICTNLVGAPAASCSVQGVVPAFCSVIGGAPGQLCRQ